MNFSLSILTRLSAIAILSLPLSILAADKCPVNRNMHPINYISKVKEEWGNISDECFDGTFGDVFIKNKENKGWIRDPANQKHVEELIDVVVPVLPEKGNTTATEHAAILYILLKDHEHYRGLVLEAFLGKEHVAEFENAKEKCAKQSNSQKRVCLLLHAVLEEAEKDHEDLLGSATPTTHACINKLEGAESPVHIVNEMLDPKGFSLTGPCLAIVFKQQFVDEFLADDKHRNNADVKKLIRKLVFGLISTDASLKRVHALARALKKGNHNAFNNVFTRYTGHSQGGKDFKDFLESCKRKPEKPGCDLVKLLNEKKGKAKSLTKKSGSHTKKL